MSVSVTDFKSIEDLFNYNIDFIKGNIDSTFYHLGPLEKDSQLIADKLLILNENDVFTFNGQGYCNDEKCIQKPYLCCYINIKHMDTLKKKIKFFNKKGNLKIKYYIYSYHDDKCFTNFNKTEIVTKITKTNQSYTDISNIFDILCYIQDRENNSVCKELESKYFLFYITIDKFNCEFDIEQFIIDIVVS